MDTSDNIGLPYIMPSQAQKHVTHNEAIGMLDALVLLAVADRDLTAPPGSPSAGCRYIVAPGGTGAWDGEDGKIAHWLDGSWSFYAPKTGWLAFVIDEAALLYWTGSSWADYSGSIAQLQNLTLLGIGTTADATNPFAARLNKALWTAKAVPEGGDGDLRYTMNKEAAANVLSLLLQSNWSGRAELGLIGDNNFSLKVSADGSSWITALTVDTATGIIHAQNRLDAKDVSIGGSNVVIDANRHVCLRSYTSATLPSASPAGQLIYCSDLGGGGGELVSDGTNWRRASGGGQQTIATNAGLTLTSLANAEEILHTGALTTNRAVTLSTTNAYPGARFRVTRTGGGSFSLVVGGLKNLANNTWAEVVYDGAAWYLAGFGAL